MIGSTYGRLRLHKGSEYSFDGYGIIVCPVECRLRGHYVRCGRTQETALHVLCDCDAAHVVWDNLVARALYVGLQFTCDRRFHGVEVESDNSLLIALLRTGPAVDSSLAELQLAHALCERS
ncbi:hypothetical protein PVK06_010317 [Gossypium arboreum]|uniref:RNase H type-1 domain-containing protein n=1 Tax=Gossypium arboreum TaxID=29729 RepID=A0ABR0Q5W3_GOSAR|nr:hypothetical protein PVK06_010317 [Gossypium arboreum]